MSTSARGLDPWSWLGWPLVIALVLTTLLAIPMRLWGLQLPEPVFPLLLAYAWAVIRPSILAPFGLLLMGLYLDLLWGSRLGLWGVGLLLAYGFVLGTRSMMAGQSKPMMWAWYGAAGAVGMGTVFLCTMLQVNETPSLLAVGWQYLATILLYPFADRLIDRFEDADVRFR